MAVCSQCGESIRDDAAFCTACGNAVGSPATPTDGDAVAVETPPAEQPVPPTETPPSAVTPPEQPPTAPSNKRPLLIGVAVAAVVGIIAVGVWIVVQQSTSDDQDTVAATTSASLDTTVSTSTTEAPTTTSTTVATTTTTTTLPPELLSELEATGVFVQDGSRATPESLQRSVDMAQAQNWDLSTVAIAADPQEGASAYAGSIATALNAGTVLVVTPTTLGWATQETKFYPEEFDRAWSLIPETSTEDDAVREFVTSVLGGSDSVGVMDPTSAFWLLLRFDGTSTEFTFGDPGDVPIVGDWDCDGIATPAVWRRSNGDLYLRNSNTAGEADLTSSFLEFEAVPIVGDFNGNGCDNISFYYPTDGLVSIFNTPETDLAATEGTTESNVDYYFGDGGDVPFAGDFDGDGIDTLGLFRPSTGVFHLKNSHTDGAADVEFAFGEASDIPIAGDWGVDDGVDTVAVYRPDTGTFFFRHDNSAGPADDTFELGVLGAVPLAGSFGLDRSG